MSATRIVLSPGTYDIPIPAGAVGPFRMRGWGGGAGGASGGVVGSTNADGGGGGQGGGYFDLTVAITSLPASIHVVVGAGSAGAAGQQGGPGSGLPAREATNLGGDTIITYSGQTIKAGGGSNAGSGAGVASSTVAGATLENGGTGGVQGAGPTPGQNRVHAGAGGGAGGAANVNNGGPHAGFSDYAGSAGGSSTGGGGVASTFWVVDPTTPGFNNGTLNVPGPVAGNGNVPPVGGGGGGGGGSGAGNYYPLPAGNTMYSGAAGNGATPGGGGGGSGGVNNWHPVVPTNQASTSGAAGNGGDGQVILDFPLPPLSGNYPLTYVPVTPLVNMARPISITGRFKA